MKYLLNGVAIAAVLAIAAPVWAQNAPMTPAPRPPAAAAPAAAAPAAAAPTASAKQRHHRRAMHEARHEGRWHRGHRNESAGDRMTDQLNRGELARIQSGAPPSGPGDAPPAGPRPSGH